MNNNYDRGETPGEERERLAREGWEMTGDGFWFKEEKPETKLLLLQSGENILTGVSYLMEGNEVILHNPKIVTLDVATSGLETTIGYSDYQPLSRGRTFRIKSSFIVATLDPLDDLAQSYETQVGGSADG